MKVACPAPLSPLGVALLLAGASATFLLRELPSLAVLIATAIAAGALAWRWPVTRVLALPLLAAAWTGLHAQHALSLRLPTALEGEDLVLIGRIEGLPQRGERRLAFDLRVVHGEDDTGLGGRRLRLAWYGNAPELVPGDVWRLPVRLRVPRGVVNPGGFDYERHAFAARIAATGHVREGAGAQRLTEGRGVDALRAWIASRLAASVESPAVRFLQGLAVGDRRGLESADWERLRATGLSHLLAISGLHIGLLAGFGALLAGGLYRLWPALGLRVPRPQGAAVLALMFALGYALLAGFGLPTQRALIMLSTVLAAVLLRRALGPAQALALAAAVILLVDPLALLTAGFWLSFLGVGWLLLCLPQTRGVWAWAGGLARAQIALGIGLLPLTVWFFGQASLAGAIANLIAVPLVGLAVVPLTLLGTVLLAWPAVAQWPLGLAAWLMALLWRGAGWLEALPWAQVFLPEPSTLGMMLALLGCAWLLIPRGVPGKPLALLLFAPLLLPPRAELAEGAVELVMIDVGQGLAVLVRSREHALLFDAGPAFEGGLDFGEAAVLPALRAFGVRRLDVLVVSHGDTDHAGGAAAIRRALPVSRTLAGEPARTSGSEPCVKGDAWRAGAVTFEVLHPPQHFPPLGNEASCVLRIQTPVGALLLPGDIGEVIEARLVREQAERLPSRVLVVPHHGSSGSSSLAFIEAVQPQSALVAAGHRNRFGHPRVEVVARYRERGASVDSTAESGALRVVLEADGGLQIERFRELRRRFWHSP